VETEIMMPFFKRSDTTAAKPDTDAEAEPHEEQEGRPTIPSELPILPLRNTVVFPFPVLTPLAVEQPRSVRLIDEVALGDRIIGLVAMHDSSVAEPGPNEVYKVGTAAIIHRLFKSPDGSIRLFIQGLERIRIDEWTSTDPYLRARVTVDPPTTEESTVELQALMRSTVDLFKRLVDLVPNLPDELSQAASNIDDPLNLVYLIASSLRMEVKDAQEILELDDVADKMRKLMTFLNRELEVLELGRKIQNEAQSEMSKVQREYFLREQLKAIQKELGEGSEQEREYEEYKEKIAASGMSEEARREADRELERLHALPAAAAEYSVIKNYLDWLVTLPWTAATPDNLDILRAREILDEDHYDIQKVKDRILEFLAVRKLHEERQRAAKTDHDGEGSASDGASPADGQRENVEPYATGYHGAILLFVGPPGVGKTSLGKSIARALGRRFIRMSLGGMRDEAEIRGHRRTYVGAMPGRIIQSMRRAGSRNPVFILDEVDKIGADWRGDPSSALLEVLDPAQNSTFRDHYLDVDFDLSQVMFIATANILDTIPEPLRDRMEVIRLDGYTDDEKVQIARNYLVPRQIEANSLRPDEIAFTDLALRKIAEDYTQEAGVRSLEREIGSVVRKVVTKIASGQAESVTVDEGDVRAYLGKPRFYSEVAERLNTPGVVTGLFATSAGGGILFIEATRMPGGKGLVVTGQLGDVMKESAQIALSYVRSRLKALDVPEDFFAHNDIHVHVPEGAIPKDGPSAGITLTTAIASLLTGRQVKPDLAMTGEITLRGKVLPVGGIKQKILAAHRAGLKQVILPRRNEPDLDDLPEQVREEMKFHLVDTMDEVLELALEGSGITAEELAEAAAEPVGAVT